MSKIFVYCKLIKKVINGITGTCDPSVGWIWRECEDEFM